MTTFTTTITQMYTIPNPTGYVVNVIYEVSGVDGQYTASIGGNSQFTPTQGETGYTPYQDLTEATVIGWIPAEQIASAQACVQGQIDSMITPPVSPENTPLPWSNT
jgi:hypothetical protein